MTGFLRSWSNTINNNNFSCTPELQSQAGSVIAVVIPIIMKNNPLSGKGREEGGRAVIQEKRKTKQLLHLSL